MKRLLALCVAVIGLSLCSAPEPPPFQQVLSQTDHQENGHGPLLYQLGRFSTLTRLEAAEGSRLHPHHRQDTVKYLAVSALGLAAVGLGLVFPLFSLSKTAPQFTRDCRGLRKNE